MSSFKYGILAVASETLDNGEPITMRSLVSFLPFLLIVLGGGILIGTATAPGDWYAALQKPWFNPPNWIFGPVWSVLYVIMAFVGWRQWKIDKNSRLMQLWYLQLGLNFAWSPVFFAAQKPTFSLMIILLLLLVILLFIRLAWRSDRLSSVLFLPYLAWVSFATALNAAIAVLN